MITKAFDTIVQVHLEHASKRNQQPCQQQGAHGSHAYPVIFWKLHGKWWIEETAGRRETESEESSYTGSSFRYPVDGGRLRPHAQIWPRRGVLKSQGILTQACPSIVVFKTWGPNYYYTEFCKMSTDESRTKEHASPSTNRADSSYTTMVVESHNVQTRYTILAAFFHWLFLIGFVVFPGTFASLDRIGVLNSPVTRRAIQLVTRNVPLLYVAGLCCLLGGLGLAWLWWTIRYNYVWLLTRVFL